MSKRNRQKRKIKKLIQKRLKEIQSQSSSPIKAPVFQPEITKTKEKTKNLSIKQEEENRLTEKGEKSEKEIIRMHPDFQKIGILLGILGIVIIGIAIINLKTPLLNTLANKLLAIFQNS